MSHIFYITWKLAMVGMVLLIFGVIGLWWQNERTEGIAMATAQVAAAQTAQTSVIAAIQAAATQTAQAAATQTAQTAATETASVPPTSTPMPPDLIVSELNVSPSFPIKGENVTATAKVCNKGEQAATGSMTVSLKPDRDLSKTINSKIANLKPFQCKNVRFNYSYSKPGEFNTVVTINVESIKDSDPDNNQSLLIVPVSPRLARVSVSIDQIKLIQTFDGTWPPENYELYYFVKINNNNYIRIPSKYYYILEKGEEAHIGKVFKFELEDDQLLKIEIEGWDADDNPDDFMGRISEEYDLSGGNWTGGTYTKKGSQPGNGSYEVTYTIKVDWS